jgi:hypothetical protein
MERKPDLIKPVTEVFHSHPAPRLLPDEALIRRQTVVQAHARLISSESKACNPFQALRHRFGIYPAAEIIGLCAILAARIANE